MPGGTAFLGLLRMSVETKPVKRSKSRERGSTLVEFSLTLLPLLAFILLTIDTAWVIFAWASIHEAVRAGVRFAITGQVLSGYSGQDASIQAVVQQNSFGFVNRSNVSAAVQIHYYSPTNLTELYGANSNAGDNVVKIVVSGISINPLGPLWRSSSPVTLSASSSDVMEPSPNGVPPQR